MFRVLQKVISSPMAIRRDFWHCKFDKHVHNRVLQHNCNTLFCANLERARTWAFPDLLLFQSSYSKSAFLFGNTAQKVLDLRGIRTHIIQLTNYAF